MRPEDISKLDQAGAAMADMYASLWKRLHDNLIEAGFERQEALDLLKVYVHGQAGGKWS